MTHSNPRLVWSGRKIATIALSAAAAVALSWVVLAANAHTDYDRPPTPEHPVRLRTPASSRGVDWTSR